MSPEAKEFSWHPEVVAHLPKLRILAVCVLPRGESFVVREVQLLPADGEWIIDSEGKACLQVKKTVSWIDSSKLFSVTLLGSLPPDHNVARFQVIFGNGHNESPPGLLEGRFGVMVHGEEPWIDSYPSTQLAHGVTFGDVEVADAYMAAETQIGDQQQVVIDFLVGFGPSSSGSLYHEILNPMAVTEDPGIFVTPVSPRAWQPNIQQRYYDLLTRPRDVKDTLGYRPNANWSGPDERFGGEPEPLLSQVRSGRAIAIVRAELQRIHSRYAIHTGLAEGYLAVPDPRAIYYDGPLSWHSRNRLGRPDRYAPDEVKERFREGIYDVIAPRAEWVGSTVPELAWYGHDWWAKLQCVELGYRQMNMMHDPHVSIQQGGYDTPFMYILRALMRGLNVLVECGRVVQREEWHTHAVSFFGHAALVLQWVEELWAPEEYGLVPRRPDEQVPGHEGEPILPAWQAIHFPAVWWIRENMPSSKWDAERLLLGLGRKLLASYVKQSNGEFWMRKIVLARDPAVGWDPHPSLDGLIYWPFSSVKLIAQKGREIGFDDDEADKAAEIVEDLERRWPALTSGPWVNNVSEWGCGDF